MSRLFALVLLALLMMASALPWDSPPQTFLGTSTANWSPAPTKGATRDFRLVPRELVAADSICGYIGGSAALMASCSTDSSCAWNSDNSYVGCCAKKNDYCTFYTSCVDKNSPKQSTINSNVYTCSGTSVCYQNTYQGEGDYYQYGCGYSSWATFVVTAIDGIGSVIVQYTSNVDSPSTSSSSTVTSTTSDSPAVASSSTSGSGSTTISTSPTTSLESSNTASPDLTSPAPIGAITGGIVGGTAVVAALLCFCFIGRRKGWFKPKSSQNLQPSPAETPPLYSESAFKAELATHEHTDPKEMPSNGSEQSYMGDSVSMMGSPAAGSVGTMSPQSRPSPVMYDERFRRPDVHSPIYEVE